MSEGIQLYQVHVWVRSSVTGLSEWKAVGPSRKRGVGEPLVKPYRFTREDAEKYVRTHGVGHPDHFRIVAI